MREWGCRGFSSHATSPWWQRQKLLWPKGNSLHKPTCTCFCPELSKTWRSKLSEWCSSLKFQGGAWADCPVMSEKCQEAVLLSHQEITQSSWRWCAHGVTTHTHASVSFWINAELDYIFCVCDRLRGCVGEIWLWLTVSAFKWLSRPFSPSQCCHFLT